MNTYASSPQEMLKVGIRYPKCCGPENIDNPISPLLMS